MTKREKLIEDVFIADAKLRIAEEKVKLLLIEYNKATHALQQFINQDNDIKPRGKNE